MPHPSGKSKAWLVAVGLVSGGLLIYLGVTVTSPGPPESAGAVSGPVRFGLWTDSTWQMATLQPALVLLLVGDSLVVRSQEAESLLSSNASIRSLFGSHYLPLRVCRRARPDLAERYAEGQIPHLSVLLPTGEALARVTGDPESWLGQLVEAHRYWRDHQSEIQTRAAAFWEEIQADTTGQAAQPDVSDLSLIDSSVFELLDTLLAEPAPGAALWRTDFDRYLVARGGTKADSVLQALRAARQNKAGGLLVVLLQEATPAVWARTVIELHLYGGQADPGALGEVQMWFAQNGGPQTAEEFALTQRLARLLERDLAPSYPGTWLGLDSTSASALPHLRHSPTPLDGYLMDAIAWLELFLENERLHPYAAPLADSLWSNLWDPRALALCDKPPGSGPVRERRVYPRAQLGRVAKLLDHLARQSGDSRFSARADSCLAGFAPYVRQAGSAATYYGEALLSRGQPGGPGRTSFAEPAPDGAERITAAAVNLKRVDL